LSVRDWLRSPAARAVEDLRADVRKLAAVVERIESVQRKEGEQLKKLRAAVSATDEASSRLLASLTEAAKAHAAESREVAQALERIETGRLTDAKWRKIFNNQLSAIIRHVCLPLDRLKPPYALTARRFRMRSQNEEDGMLLALLERAGWGQSRFVEIGSGKSGGNAAGLAHECGWSGLMIELSERSVEGARKKFAGNRGITVVGARVTPANINALLAEHGYAGEVDLLSIDIDSYDYWVLEALTGTSPRILVLEYNALFGPERRVTIPLDQPLDATPKGYNGASLAALADLASRKGYRLVACEHAGVNAFFLRHDVAPDTPAVTPVEAFRPLRVRTDIDDAEVATDIYAAIEKHQLRLVEV
jgi:hypothetical protein